MKKEILINRGLWGELAPFSIIFGKDGTVKELSHRLLDVWCLGDDEQSIKQVNDEILLSRPFDSPLLPELLPNLTELTVHLELSSCRGRIMRGQLYPHGDEWLFSGFPMVSTIIELEAMGVMLSDLPLSAGLGERLIANETTIASAKDASDQSAKLFIANDILEQTLETFARFVPNKFLTEVGITSPLEARLGSHVESRKAIMFADLLGFTSISEGLSAGEIFEVINQYLSCTVPCIEANGGFVIHYLGDGIMALFPSGNAGALQAAIDMQKALKLCRGEHNHHDFELKMSIGLHEGPVALGIVGDKMRWDASIISDAVNTSSRIEAKTRVLGGEIIVSRAFLNTVKKPSDFMLRGLGVHEIRGRTKKIELIEVLDSLDDELILARKATLSDFNYGVAAFKDDDMYLAMSCFSRVLSVDPDDKASQVYLSIIAKSIAKSSY